jgi:uncharacterized protein (TIGR02145 family)
MSCNYDIAYPGSRVYDDDEANRAIYGGLYTYNQVIDPAFCPAGWHVPTEAEWNTLIAYLGGTAIAGASLKQSGTTNWNPPNPVTSPVTCFEALGAGDYNASLSAYQLLNEFCYFRTVTPDAVGTAKIVWMAYNGTNATLTTALNTHYFSVRLIRDGSVYQGMGALYNWFAVNGATMESVYGALYNWYAATHVIAPTGWHIPTVAEFEALATFLGGDLIAGGHLKESGFAHWDNPNTDADNSSLFTALGAGTRSELGAFTDIKRATSFQTIDRDNIIPGMPDRGILTIIFISGSSFFGSEVSNNYGTSIRLIKDDSTDPGTVTDIDGNVYNTIKIDTQVWMAENLKVEHYNDGSPIPIISDDILWAADIDGAMCYYNNE